MPSKTSKMILIVTHQGPPSDLMREITIEKLGLKARSRKFDGFLIYEGTFEEYLINLITVKKEIVYTDYVFQTFSPELAIFLSKHSSEKGIPSLCVHCTGNFGKAELGGKDKCLSIAHAPFMKNAVNYLAKHKIPGFEIAREVTHHGPTPLVPVIFLEVGSGEKEWKNEEASELIVECMIYCLERLDEVYESCICFGGPHYSPFIQIDLQTKYATGHILPKWAQGDVSKEIIKQMIKRTYPEPKFAVIDKKGLSKESREKILKWLDEMGVEVKKKRNLLKG